MPEGPRKLFHPPNDRKDSTFTTKAFGSLLLWISVLPPHQPAASRMELCLRLDPSWEAGLSACLNNRMEFPHLAEEPGQVFFDLSLIPRPMNVFFKKL